MSSGTPVGYACITSTTSNGIVVRCASRSRRHVLSSSCRRYDTTATDTRGWSARARLSSRSPTRRWAARRRRSVSTAGRQNGRERPKHDAEISPEAPSFDVLELDRRTLGVVHRRTATHLPLPRHPGLERQEQRAFAVVMMNLVGHDRAWAHERHVPLEDVPQLWKLVETRAAQEPAYPGDARIDGCRQFVVVVDVATEQRRVGEQPGFGVDEHRTELVASDRATEPTQPSLGKHDRPGRIELHESGGEREDRREQH